jgi:hypothetical protein
MFDARTAPLAPRYRIDRQELAAGMLTAMISLLSVSMFVMLYLPLR